MILEIKIPSPGESVAEVEIARWLVNDGDYVEKDQEIAEIESDKATLPLLAEESGTISIKVETGTAIEVGSVACTIDTEGKPAAGKGGGKKKATSKEKARDNGSAAVAASGGQKEGISKKPDNQDEQKVKSADKDAEDSSRHETEDLTGKIKVSPLARKLMEKEGMSVNDVLAVLKRITKEDVALAAAIKDKSQDLRVSPLKVDGRKSRSSERQRMSMLRRKLSERLVAVKNKTAMLTTFNEVDMSHVIEIRKKNQSAFTEKHGVKLGFMSFFAKAVTEALKTYPNINSYIDGEDIVTPAYYDISIAVQTEKGLMVPVIRNVEAMTLAGIEKAILEIAEKARKNRISIDDMTGGTFTITNGGVFGSLLSTPILNPPQSGILGIHNITERPVAVNGKVEIRPMMYIALSYDHRIIDGRESVGFLVKVKELLENPSGMLFGGADPVKMLLDL